MICGKELREELKRLPRLINAAIRRGDVIEAIEMTHTKNVISWILDNTCECKK